MAGKLRCCTHRTVKTEDAQQISHYHASGIGLGAFLSFKVAKIVALKGRRNSMEGNYWAYGPFLLPGDGGGCGTRWLKTV